MINKNHNFVKSLVRFLVLTLTIYLETNTCLYYIYFLLMTEHLKQTAQETLTTLITDEGIFASSNKGNQGIFHGYFGRDTIITACLVLEAERNQEKKQFTRSASAALQNLALWQGTKDNPVSGEEVGKISHEVRLKPEHYGHLIAIDKPWYVDEHDNALKNWDGIDSTPLWVVGMMKFQELGALEITPNLLGSIKNALEWVYKSSSVNNCAFTHNPHRQYGGLYNKGWKDSYMAHLDEQGSLPDFPLRDVWVTGLHWTAMKYGARLFRYIDMAFSEKLIAEATRLKTMFNDEKEGFLIQDSGRYYFAEVIDGKGNKLRAITIDPALNLWSHFEGECIIEAQYISDVVERIQAGDMYSKMCGVGVYSSKTLFFDELKYHRGPNTYWPFTNALLCIGLERFGYAHISQNILHSMLSGVAYFGHCIELYLMDKGEIQKYVDPHGVEACSDQAWTAAGVYYGFNKLSEISLTKAT
jgi:glycogen debranching enzyme